MRKEIDKEKEIVNTVLHWSRRNIRDFPWRNGFSPYRVLIAELLLRRTTAQAVQRVYDEFIETYPDLQHLSKASIGELEDRLKTLGYHRLRAILIREVVSEMLSKYKGIPDTLEELLSIKHIGLYTAAAIISLGYNKPLPMVDTNVLRILGRVYGRSMTQQQAFELLKGKLPVDSRRFNLSLLDFGALVCRYKNPLCHVCPLNDSCTYYQIKVKNTKYREQGPS
ncbi:HhH-GPD family protein [Nitrososphaera viennensis]|uniref:HhH-GPD domain-containing protein n=2 Tax=Nitrososphaera viennensis TaxID=1034015 RepID=A0A977IE05_9ARCH|nr:hypothetical protein [Nitrososphaera viennensis]AIC14306.1 putative HhH-GPD superfamily base excision DNA repair protein [Nitrososphaera viennensis EN76]UVS69299.1 hypothetical protein NWT39_00580 [Nitrososphaera viennensis]